MRTSKAYIAGVGTTSVLVASALLLLAVVSTLVAFNGWPGTGLAESIGNLVVDEPEGLPADPPVQVATAASAAAAGVASVPAPGSAAAGGPAAPTGLTGAGVPVAITPGGGGGGPPPDGRDPQLRDDPVPPPKPVLDEPGGLLPQSPVSDGVSRLTGGLGDTTQGLTDGLGNSVAQLNPGLGQVLINSGRSLAELLRDLGQPAR